MTSKCWQGKDEKDNFIRLNESRNKAFSKWRTMLSAGDVSRAVYCKLEPTAIRFRLNPTIAVLCEWSHSDQPNSKDSTMTITVAQARKICNPSELDLVLLSTAKQIGGLDSKQVKAKLNRTRTLRDKWRDLSEKQIRVTKTDSQSKVAEANARTALKAQLFSETLDRFSKRLAVLEPSTATPTGTVSKITKPKRVAKHRTQRADVRTVLADTKDQLNVTLPTKQATKTKTAVKAKEKAPTVVKKSVVKKKGAVNGAKTSQSKQSTSLTASTSVVLPAAIKTPRKKKPTLSKVVTPRNMKAQAASKSTALSMGGVKSIQAHVSAQGRRNQARRNAKR